MLNVNKNDLDKLENILVDAGVKTPNVKLSIYKNRRGKYSNCYL
jgi:hypothetical protein